MLRSCTLPIWLLFLTACGSTATTPLENTIEEQADRITSLEQLLRVSEYQRITQATDEISEEEKAQKVHEHWRQRCRSLSSIETIPSDLSEKEARYTAEVKNWISHRCLAEGFVQDEVLENLRETFGPLTEFVGKSFRGIPGGDADAKADIQRWSWALGGAAIKISHAIEDGSYGGDTYVYKDVATSDLVYVYITNAEFRTEGIITLNEDGSYTADEAVTGHPTITKVRSTSLLNADGSSSMTSEMLENGEWRPGHSFTYQPTSEPLPALKAPE